MTSIFPNWGTSWEQTALLWFYWELERSIDLCTKQRWPDHQKKCCALERTHLHGPRQNCFFLEVHFRAILWSFIKGIGLWNPRLPLKSNMVETLATKSGNKLGLKAQLWTQLESHHCCLRPEWSGKTRGTSLSCSFLTCKIVGQGGGNPHYDGTVIRIKGELAARHAKSPRNPNDYSPEAACMEPT